ncbi:type VII secretion protein EccB [uncultured Corynebacterium sp.]|uniref:type VII secretion protein EccB n=1 Tax=uncultured Corynebacterium sp. TaxID=159447 RepID=UPI0025D053CF|nr:type VII secretion protein EccB [uncultured Corynebacterium sp.]
MRTTGLQVSGYSFLLRRLELALVTGDPRMAHDPLRTQRRAVGVGVLLALLVAGGMLLVAMLRPAPSVGDAALVTDESGTLHVRIGEVFHPVTNVASARLLLGSAESPSKTTAANLAEFGTGPPVGIPDAPGLVPVGDGAADEWALCGPTVVAASSMADAGPQVLAAPSGHWLVVGGERMLIPEAGPTVARALGAVPVVVDDEVVAVLRRGPDVVLPRGPSGLPGMFGEQGTLVTAGERAFLVVDGGLAEVTGTRRAVAEALASPAGAPVVSDLGSVLEVPGATALERVPVEASFRETAGVCAGATLVEVPEEAGKEQRGRHYEGPRGTVAVVTERGLALVSESGVRYTVPSPEELAALGVLDDGELPVQVPWRVIESLPDGGELSTERARRTLEVG